MNLETIIQSEASQKEKDKYCILDGLDKGQKWYGPNRREDIKKRWQEYTEELYKKGLNDPDNHDIVVTHLEPDILEGEVK